MARNRPLPNDRLAAPAIKAADEKPGLWRQFTRAARGLGDFLFLEVTFPSTKRSIITLLLWSQLGAPLTILTFPSAEDLLRKDGLDPALARQLGSDRIRVVPANLGGLWLQLSTSTSTGWALLSQIPSLIAPEEARAQAILGPLNLHRNILGLCTIALPSRDDYNVKELISTMTGGEIKPGQISDKLAYSARESYWATALHEIRHCGQDIPLFWGDKTMVESDADAQSLIKLARIFNNPQIPYVTMYARALNLHGGDHDTALYIDAALRGRPLPSRADIRGAMEELNDYLDKWHRENFGKERGFLTLTRDFAWPALEDLFLKGPKDGMTLSPLAKRRAQLYLDGMAYLTDRSVNGAGLPSVLDIVPAPH